MEKKQNIFSLNRKAWQMVFATIPWFAGERGRYLSARCCGVQCGKAASGYCSHLLSQSAVCARQPPCWKQTQCVSVHQSALKTEWLLELSVCLCGKVRRHEREESDLHLEEVRCVGIRLWDPSSLRLYAHKYFCWFYLEPLVAVQLSQSNQ